jgi:hypothetical protein
LNRKKRTGITGHTDWFTDKRLLSGSVSEWYTDRLSYQAGAVTPKIAAYRPVYREMVNPHKEHNIYTSSFQIQ